MTTRTRQNLLLFYAAGVLDADEAAAARRLLASDDPQVQAEWAHARSVVAHLTLAAPAAKAPAAARAALLERVRSASAVAGGGPRPAVTAATSQPGAERPHRGAARWWPAVLSSLAAAAAAALVVWVITDAQMDRQADRLAVAETAVAEREQRITGLQERLALAERELQTVRQDAERRIVDSSREAEALAAAADAARSTVAEREQQVAGLRDRLAAAEAERRREVADLRSRVDEADRLLRTLRSDASRRVAVEGTDAQPDAGGTLVYNPETRGVILLAQGFTPAPAGETYQLWVVTADDRKVSVGTFDVAADGRATLTATLGADPGEVAVTAVTNEPAGGSDQPTGQFQMLGKF